VIPMPYVKLDTGILDSSLWVMKTERDIFITALLMAKPRELKAETEPLKVDSLDPDSWIIPRGWYGFVEAAGPGIANRAGVDRDKGIKALKVLCSPDPESRSPEFDGRRMARVSGGYIVLNFDKYREKDHTAADRARRYRDRKRRLKDLYLHQGSESPAAALARIEAKRERERQLRAETSHRDVTYPSCNITQAEAEAEAEANNPSPTSKGSRARARKTTAKKVLMAFRKRGDEWVSDCGDYTVYVSRRIRQGDETEVNWAAKHLGRLFPDPTGICKKCDTYGSRGEAQQACREHKRRRLAEQLGQDPATLSQTSPETRRSGVDPSSDPSESPSPSDGSQGSCRRCGRAQDRYRGNGKLCSACHQLGKQMARHDGLSPGINDERAQAILEALLSHATLDGIGDRVGVANWHAARLGPNSPNKLTVERVFECIGIVAQEAQDHKLETGELKSGRECIKHLRHLTAMHEHEYASARAKAKEREEPVKPRKKERYVPPSGPDPKTRRATLQEMTNTLSVSSDVTSKPFTKQQAPEQAGQLIKKLGGDMAIGGAKVRPEPSALWCDSCETDTHNSLDCKWFKESLKES